MEVFEKVVSIVRDQTNNNAEIIGNTNLADDLGIDSFGAIMIVNAVEDEFSITFDGSDLEKFKTVDDIVNTLINDYLEKKR